MSGERSKKRPIGCFVTIAVVLGLVLYTALSYYLSNYTLAREKVTVKLARLPKSFDGMKIAHLSDVHGKTWGEDNRDLIRILEKARPNIIALTGDFVDTPEDFDWAEALTAQLVKIAPTYFVTGNHEFHEWQFGYLKQRLKDNGVIVLDNDYIMLESGDEQICLLGRIDPHGSEDPDPLRGVVREVRSLYGDPFILALSHRYDLFDEYKEYGLDLVLSGHAHGGIVRLPFTDGLVSPYREFWPKRTSGLYVEDGTAMVVSRGMDGPGSGPRLFNRCHVLIETLRTA